MVAFGMYEQAYTDPHQPDTGNSNPIYSIKNRKYL